ncbi:MAG: gamma-glutamylcyclotransferase [Clostridia bacterium]|nr:gamma-glutamylcyclotransferase [Clostridia bacterium]
MKDRFFTKKHCDRCGASLEGGRIMSMYNEDCICMKCKDAETKRSDYKDAQNAEIAEVKKGNYNFKGIGQKQLTKKTKSTNMFS